MLPTVRSQRRPSFVLHLDTLAYWSQPIYLCVTPIISTTELTFYDYSLVEARKFIPRHGDLLAHMDFASQLAQMGFAMNHVPESFAMLDQGQTPLRMFARSKIDFEVYVYQANKIGSCQSVEQVNVPNAPTDADIDRLSAELATASTDLVTATTDLAKAREQIKNLQDQNKVLEDRLSPKRPCLPPARKEETVPSKRAKADSPRNDASGQRAVKWSSS
ncbi:hypothetical protein G6011_00209 [Alternaria panax]|uniref:Uncharacterized protein n=1 Tax=Alternaria panax TaxID=48097 RepID=A0AAD4IIE6_9PLEO|nr:hypothetical protein G6011_00209 [Alternaria panax]